MSWKDSNLFNGLLLIFWSVILFAGKMRSASSGRCSDWTDVWRTGCQTYIRCINFFVQNCLSSFSVISHSMHKSAISLFPNKMLAWRQQCAKVIQFQWAECYRPNLQEIFIVLPPAVWWRGTCVSCTFGIQTTCSAYAVPRQHCLKGFVKQKYSGRSKRDKISPHPGYCGKLSAVVREGLEADVPKLPSHATLGLKIWDLNPGYERRVPECLRDRINLCVEAEGTCWSMLLFH